MSKAWEGAGKGRGGRPWRRLREEVFQRDNYLCVPCRRAGRLTPAEECDHIVGLAKGGTDDMSNLQAICKDCHQAKDRPMSVPKGCDADGVPFGTLNALDMAGVLLKRDKVTRTGRL